VVVIVISSDAVSRNDAPNEKGSTAEGDRAVLDRSSISTANKWAEMVNRRIPNFAACISHSWDIIDHHSRQHIQVVSRTYGSYTDEGAGGKGERSSALA